MFKILDKECTPTRGSKFSAAVDLCSSEDVAIGAGETKKIPLGITLDYDKFPLYIKNNMKSFYLELHPRSSIMTKNGLIGNVGIIDIDYTGEICMIFHNPICGDEAFIENEDGDIHNEFIGGNLNNYYTIKKGDRIAQITLLEHKSYLFNIHSEDERVGGFGSTDKKDIYKSAKMLTDLAIAEDE